eukprot:1047741-Prymnesium_polylepis.1
MVMWRAAVVTDGSVVRHMPHMPTGAHAACALCVRAHCVWSRASVEGQQGVGGVPEGGSEGACGGRVTHARCWCVE